MTTTKPLDPTIVIQAALLVDDHYDIRTFLRAWVENDSEVLAEFQDEINAAAQFQDAVNATTRSDASGKMADEDGA